MKRRVVFGLWCGYVIARWPSATHLDEKRMPTGRLFFEPTRMGYRIRNWLNGGRFAYGQPPAAPYVGDLKGNE